MRSTVSEARLDERIEKHLASPDRLKLMREVAVLRAFAEDLIERWESVYGPEGALLARHESFRNTAACVGVSDIRRAGPGRLIIMCCLI